MRIIDGGQVPQRSQTKEKEECRDQVEALKTVITQGRGAGN